MPELTHAIVVGFERRLDGRWYRAVCACGKYRSGVYGSADGARRAGDQHVKAKTQP